MKKVRADLLVLERGLAESRAKAQAMILAGQVLTTDGKRIDKAGQLLSQDSPLHIKGARLKFVSRGGLKLEGALESFGVDVRDYVCFDVGASTGGFTDCLLQRGATKVYAIDVGYNQLDYRLRNDPRVISMERFNVRHLAPDDLPELVDFICFDVSFISLELVLEPALRVAKAGTELVMLVKPQFEVGRENVGKGGIVRDEVARQAALDKILDVASAQGLQELQTIESPITGTDGNVEFLLYGRWKG